VFAFGLRNPLSRKGRGNGYDHDNDHDKSFISFWIATGDKAPSQ
jgi:hypothetical protein